MKHYRVLIPLLFLLFLSGCADQVRVMWTDDPLIEEANKQRFKELDEYFNKKYPEKNTNEMSQDKYYEEWRNLDPALQQITIHTNSAPGNFSSEIDLKNQTYTYKEKTYDYQMEENKIILKEANLPLYKENIPKYKKTNHKLTQKARQGYQEDKTYNRYLLLKTIWLPILFVVIGILSIKRPDWIWFLEDGHKYKDAEPSNFALGLNIFRGVIGIVLALAYLYFILRSMR